MPEIARTDDEVNDQISKADEGQNQGSKFPGMSYEEGVIAALDWITGVNDDAPMDE